MVPPSRRRPHRYAVAAVDPPPEADRLPLRAAGAAVRRRLHPVSVHPDVLDLAQRLGPPHPAGVRRDRQLPPRVRRRRVLAIVPLHAEVHGPHHPDPHRGWLPARPADLGEHAAAPVHPRRRVHSGRDRARRIEPVVVLAVQRPLRTDQPGADRARHHRRADPVARRRSEHVDLGDHHLDHVEGARLRHDPVRRRDPGDSQEITEAARVDGANAGSARPG